MTSPNPIQGEESDYEFEVYRSTQDGMLSIRCERWAEDADARRLAEAILAELPLVATTPSSEREGAD